MKNIPLIALIFLFSCGNPQNNFELAYKHEHKAFSERTLDFYLQLVGLFELSPTLSNSFGLSQTNDFVITVPGTPDNIGSLEFKNDSIIFESANNIDIKTSQGIQVDKINLSILRDRSEDLFYGRLSWRIIKFGEKTYLRVRDLESDRVKTFKGFKYFEPNSEFILKGKVTMWDQPKLTTFPTALNVDQDNNVVGKVSFIYKGQEYELLMDWEYGTKFTDETSGDETYGAGRYMRVIPDEDGVVFLDFNYAWNPPCSVSEFTTCIFAPKENHLPFKVLAGQMAEEKK